MAVSKDTRSGSFETDPLFLKLFRKHPLSEEREQTWRNAVQHAGTGTPPLRFPVYEHLYRLNACAQEMVELLEQLSGKFSMARDPLLHCQSLIQYVRASASQMERPPRKLQNAGILTKAPNRSEGRSYVGAGVSPLITPVPASAALIAKNGSSKQLHHRLSDEQLPPASIAFTGYLETRQHREAALTARLRQI